MSLGEIYKEHHPAVLAMARRQLGDPTEADDAAATTFSLLMTINGPHQRAARQPEVRSFVLGVCKNVIRRMRRSHFRNAEAHARFSVESPMAVDDIEGRIAARQIAARLTGALESLPEEQRMALLLSAIDGYSAGDIARLCHTPEATVRTRLFHARRKLRESLESRPSSGRRVAIAAGAALLIVLGVFGPRAVAAHVMTAYHAVLREISSHHHSDVVAPHGGTTGSSQVSRSLPKSPTGLPDVVSALPNRAVAPIPTIVLAPTDNASSVSAPPLAQHEPALRSNAVDRVHGAYLRAHQAQFVVHDYAAALRGWDFYLAHAPRGTFALEARYNRAIALAQLGRIEEARAALALFADGTHEKYRQQDAKRLLDVLDE